MKIDKYKHFYMDVAIRASQESVAKRLQVGCCIVTESGALYTGWNGTYAGCESNECEDVVEPDEWVDQTQVVTKDVVIHAEHNALLKMLSEGVKSKGASVFVTHACCNNCALMLIGAKVKEVFYIHDYRCTKGLDMLREADIVVHKYKEEG